MNVQQTWAVPPEADALSGSLQGQIDAALDVLASARRSMQQLASSAEGALTQAAASHRSWQKSLEARSNRSGKPKLSAQSPGAHAAVGVKQHPLVILWILDKFTRLLACISSTP
jgi:hypothetical protein